MLIKCNECGLQISSKAVFCPHCGLPLKSSKISYKSVGRRKRLPNGFGQITKLNRPSLRSPYRAMVTIGTNQNGRPICKLLKPKSYFRTYNEAYEALIEYNKNPFDITVNIKASELYERWKAEYTKHLKSESTVRQFDMAWNYCSSIYSEQFSNIRPKHIKFIIENGTNKKGKYPTPVIKSRIKGLFDLLFDYAVEYEIVDRNYSRGFKLNKEITKAEAENKTSHISFTKEEMDSLWANRPLTEMLLVQCYTGFRPQELLNIKLDDIKGNYIIGGLKTSAGKNRVVPIHSRIKEIIDSNIEESRKNKTEWLFHDGKKQISYANYLQTFREVIRKLSMNPDHRPHDCRKQFVTMGKENGMDEYAIKRIVGHTIQDITESVYTDRSIEWLCSEIEKIT